MRAFCVASTVTHRHRFQQLVHSGSEIVNISTFRIACGCDLVQSSEGESVYSAVMSAHDVT